MSQLTGKFRDPTSPFYIAPGTPGPAHENDHQHSVPPTTSSEDISIPPADEPDYRVSRYSADEHAAKHGFDVRTRVEVPVAWGEQDMFRHVNNVHFGRYFEVIAGCFCL